MFCQHCGQQQPAPAGSFCIACGQSTGYLPPTQPPPQFHEIGRRHTIIGSCFGVALMCGHKGEISFNLVFQSEKRTQQLKVFICRPDQICELRTLVDDAEAEWKRLYAANNSGTLNLSKR